MIIQIASTECADGHPREWAYDLLRVAVCHGLGTFFAQFFCTVQNVLHSFAQFAAFCTVIDI